MSNKASLTILMIQLLVVSLLWSSSSIAQPEESPPSSQPYQLKKQPTTTTTIANTKTTVVQKSNFVFGLSADQVTAISTFLLVVVGAITAFILIWQSVLLRRSVNLSRNMFYADQRPWIGVNEITPESDFDLKSGLTFTFVIENFGKSPGINVDISATMHLPHQDDDLYAIQNIIKEEQLRTKNQLENHEVSYGQMITPGTEFRRTVRCEYNFEEYRKAAALNPGGGIIIFIVGQVIYRSVGNNTWHQTGFVFSVMNKNGRHIHISEELTHRANIRINNFGAGFYAT